MKYAFNLDVVVINTGSYSGLNLLLLSFVLGNKVLWKVLFLLLSMRLICDCSVLILFLICACNCTVLFLLMFILARPTSDMLIDNDEDDDNQNEQEIQTQAIKQIKQNFKQ